MYSIVLFPVLLDVPPVAGYVLQIAPFQAHVSLRLGRLCVYIHECVCVQSLPSLSVWMFTWFLSLFFFQDTLLLSGEKTKWRLLKEALPRLEELKAKRGTASQH